jgi:hypothetical protein
MATVDDLDRLLKQKARRELRNEIQADIRRIWRWNENIPVTVATAGATTVKALLELVESAIFASYETARINMEIAQFLSKVESLPDPPTE